MYIVVSSWVVLIDYKYTTMNGTEMTSNNSNITTVQQETLTKGNLTLANLSEFANQYTLNKHLYKNIYVLY